MSTRPAIQISVPGSQPALSQAIKAEARRLGFALVGITTPEPPAHIDVYERWLKTGHHGKMSYLSSERARQRRSDPRQILPECRSILVLGMHYATSSPDSSIIPLNGRIASYAWGTDYHMVLPERLHDLVNFIRVQVGAAVPNRIYTDTGPLLERDLAQRAGLGWIGKNTCLIHPSQGSYFLLAEILLGLELEPDPPFTADRCGSCTRCLEACPTGCILPDRTLDARRCISYLTIELKGSIPSEVRPQMGSWVFGCDICQLVCPWNLRFARKDNEVDPALAAQPGIPQPNLLEELSLTAQEFKHKFKGSPIQRAKRRGYLRNVSVALGNAHDPAAIPALTQSLMEEPEPLIRSHAAWALGQIDDPQAKRALSEAVSRETDPGVQSEIRAALLEPATA